MVGVYFRGIRWLKEPIDAQRLDLLYGGSSGSALVGMIEAFIISSLFWQDVAGAAVATWLIVFLCVRLARITLSRAYWRARQDSAPDLARWRRLMLISATLQALAWSLGAFVLVAPDNLVAEWALHLGLAAVAHASAVRLAQHGPAMLIYTVGIFVPLMARDLWVGQPSHLLLAGATVLLATYVLSSGIRQTVAIIDAVHQRRRNAELIEELKQENTARLDAQQQAESAHAFKTRFLAAISHDLRQPLNALALLAHTLQQHPDKADVAQLSARIVDCTTNMTELVDGLMELSQLDVNELQPNIESFQLSVVLQAQLGTHLALAESRGLQLRVDDTQAVVHTDPRLLSRVLANLIANAIRYTDQGHVWVKVLEGDTLLGLQVADTGRGMAPHELAQVFDEFYQAGNPQRDPRLGLGLGLANVQRLSHLLGLQVSVTSQPGQGSVFSLTLPRAAPGSVTQPETTAPAPDAFYAGRRILVVEDDPASQHALRTLLETWGCVVTTAGNASETHAALRRGDPPEVVIADFRLEGDVNGLELICALRAQTRSDLPALLVSADTANLPPLPPEEGIAVLAKPVQAMRLRAFLAHALSKH